MFPSWTVADYDGPDGPDFSDEDSDEDSDADKPHHPQEFGPARFGARFVVIESDSEDSDEVLFGMTPQWTAVAAAVPAAAAVSQM